MYKPLSDGAETCIKSQNERFSAYQPDSRLLANYGDFSGP